MKKIILASNSPQRKKLLRSFGFTFKVHPSQSPESSVIRSNCAALVKENALVKARDVARHYRDGLIIGADTVVYVGGKKMIGKPKDQKDAVRILKVLFSRPQSIYTGIAVIDARSGKTLLGYEKTKVFMTPLSDNEILRYHQKVHPLDKAGGFDIEGWGSLFIRRIEGCYTNVIGLPMAKLANMLKAFGVHILSLMLLISFFGCSTEFNLATRQEERLMYGTDKEIAIGDAIARQIEEKYKVITDVDVNERVERILNKLVAVSDRKDVVYFIKVLEDDMLNAVSLPGGYIYVFRGLIEKLDTDDELAGVVAHEMGHITAKHAIKRLQASYGAILLQIASIQAGGNTASGVNLALNSLFTEYSQKDEFQADQLGVKYMRLAGYDPAKMITVLDKLQIQSEKEPIREFTYWRTHPFITQRKAIVNQEIKGKMDFRDYVNLIGREE